LPSAGEGAVGGAVIRSGGKVLLVPNLTPVIPVGDPDGSSVLPGAVELGVLGSGLGAGTQWGLAPGNGKPGEPGLPGASCNPAARVPPPG
jgi:hypothetical protein